MRNKILKRMVKPCKTEARWELKLTVSPDKLVENIIQHGIIISPPKLGQVNVIIGEYYMPIGLMWGEPNPKQMDACTNCPEG